MMMGGCHGTFLIAPAAVAVGVGVGVGVGVAVGVAGLQVDCSPREEGSEWGGALHRGSCWACGSALRSSKASLQGMKNHSSREKERKM